MLRIVLCCLAAFVFLKCFPLEAKAPLAELQSQEMTVEVEVLADDLGVIWAFDFMSGDQLLLNSRSGTMHIVTLSTGQRTRVDGVPSVKASNQGGLLDLRLHPEFKTNRLIYFSYSKEVRGKYTTVLARAKLNNKNRLEDVQLLFTAEPSFSTTHHYGSRIAFDGQGHVFLSVGDRGNRQLAQSLSTHNGKIIRLLENGGIPKDNPFVSTPAAKPEVWSFGHRNPQGLIYIDSKSELWSHEHGPRGGDELNLIEKGGNYGWPVITHGREYSGKEVGKGISEKPGMEQPKKYYVPSIAPSGLAFLENSKLPGWNNSFFIGALVLTHLNRVDYETLKEERILGSIGERFRDVRQGPDGLLYASTDSGKLLRFRAKAK